MYLVLFSTLEDFDTKILIRSLILLSFEQKKLIKKLQSDVKFLEGGINDKTDKDEARELFKENSTAAYYNHVVKQVKFTDRAEFFTKQIERETTETRRAFGNENSKLIFYNQKLYSNQ